MSGVQQALNTGAPFSSYIKKLQNDPDVARIERPPKSTGKMSSRRKHLGPALLFTGVPWNWCLPSRAAANGAAGGARANPPPEAPFSCAADLSSALWLGSLSGWLALSLGSE